MARSWRLKRTFPAGLIPHLVIIVALFVLVLAGEAMLEGIWHFVFLILAVAILSVVHLGWRWAETEGWSKPIRHLARQLTMLSEDPQQPLDLTYVPELAEVIHALRELKRAWHPVPEPTPPPSYHLGMSS